MLNSHVLKLLRDPETKMVHSVEQSSMKNKSYKVMVSTCTVVYLVMFTL